MYQNAIYTVFLDIAKFANFWWKKGDARRTQGVCYVNHVLFGSY